MLAARLLPDAARDPKIPELLSALGTAATCQCLWQGEAFLRADGAVPYLVRLNPKAVLTKLLLIEGAGKGWMLLGVFLGQEFDEVPEFHMALTGPNAEGWGDMRIKTIFREIAARMMWS